jgi:hypothetical protein
MTIQEQAEKLVNAANNAFVSEGAEILEQEILGFGNARVHVSHALFVAIVRADKGGDRVKTNFSADAIHATLTVNKVDFVTCCLLV